jgi:Avidin family
MPLTGVWVNEHKSVMVMSEDSEGRLGGTFRSLVGRDTRKRPLIGRASSEEAGKQLLGFTVCFDIPNPAEGTGHHSLCAWSGWATANEIITNWLLTSSILDPKDQWSSMRIGRDTFARVFDSTDPEYLDFDEGTLSQLLNNAKK